MFKLTLQPFLETLMDDASLDRMAEGGIRYISAPYAFFDLSDAEILSRNAALKTRGMQIDTCHTPFGGGNNDHSCCSEIEEVHAATIRMWTHYLRRFALVGVRAVPMHTGGSMRTDVPQRLRDNLTRTLDALVPIAREVGTIIALENTFYLNPPPFAGMGTEPLEDQRWLNDHCPLLHEYIEAYADPSVHVCMDVGHSNFLGHDVMDDYRALRGQIVLFHLHDNDGQMDQHFTPGMGTVPWRALSDALAADGYDLPIYVEALKDPNPERNVRMGTADALVEIFKATNAALAR